jgi:hypothetical protein
MRQHTNDLEIQVPKQDKSNQKIKFQNLINQFGFLTRVVSKSLSCRFFIVCTQKS